MKELLIIFTYTFIIAFIAVYLNKAMPSVIAWFKRTITRIPRKSNASKESPQTKAMIDKMITQAIKEKINSGLFTYHKKQMIREMVREEVIKYLNELKK